MLWLLIGILLIMVASLFGLIGFAISHIWFKPQNNPLKCIVFQTGIDRPFKGYAYDKSDDGILYKCDKDKKIILVPDSYGYEYHFYRRMLRLDTANQLIASPELYDKKLTDDEKYDLIFDIIKADIGRGAVKAIQEKGAKNLVAIVIIVAVIVAVVVGGLSFVIAKSTIKPVIIEKTIQNTPDTTKPVELPPSNIVIGK